MNARIGQGLRGGEGKWGQREGDRAKGRGQA